MWRLFRKYNAHVSYDGIPLDVPVENLPLDEIKVAGQLHLSQVISQGIRNGIQLTKELGCLTNIEQFKSMLTKPIFRQVNLRTYDK